MIMRFKRRFSPLSVLLWLLSIGIVIQCAPQETPRQAAPGAPLTVGPPSTASAAPKEGIETAKKALSSPLPRRIERDEPRLARVHNLVDAALDQRLGPVARVDSGGGSEAAETSVVGDGLELVAAWNDQRAGQFSEVWRLGVGVSFDGGVTWTDTVLRPQNPDVSRFEGDPMTAYDPRTGNFWAGGVEFGPGGRIYVARKAPGATGFGLPVTVASGSAYDKSWMAVGPAPGNPDSTRLYVAYSFPMALRVSSDLGRTWSAERPLHPDGIGFHPRVGPNGELYVLMIDVLATERVLLQRSFDGGATIEPAVEIVRRADTWGFQDGSRFPGRFRVPQLVFLAVSPVDGTLYCVYFDTTSIVGGNANVDLYFMRSDDLGSTWTAPVVIHGDSDPPGDQFFPWLEVDATGRLHLAYFDSRYTLQDDDVEDGRLDVVYAYSDNKGASWTALRLTETSFGTGGVDWGFQGQFVGDYIGLVPTGDGGAVVVYPMSGGADLDIFSRRVLPGPEIFVDGFESGNTAAWSG